IQRLGGVMTMEDLANYSATIAEPVRGTYRGYEIISCPPPSSGGTQLIEMLNILENFEIGSMQVNSAPYIHLWSETMKAVFADREKYMADTDFVEDVPLSGLLSKDYAATIANQITSVSQTWLAGDPTEYVHDSTTSYSVVDQYGTMVTVTQTLECSFGSCVAVPGYGFILNDEMHDFSTNPNSVNCVAGGKNPLSSMSPTVVLKEDGSPLMTLGTPAGPRIYTTIAQVISHVIDHKMNLQDAINTARIYDNGNAKGIEYETGCLYPITQDTVAKLQGMGHTMTAKGNWKLYFGGVQGIMYQEDGSLFGAADPRRDGKALGYE
ncbi:MAG: gamma-glutamyltransferase, partial [Agathobacter sp.]|nr:gamma-glutamyltransferase [Agathobacter sp.]